MSLICSCHGFQHRSCSASAGGHTPHGDCTSGPSSSHVCRPIRHHRNSHRLWSCCSSHSSASTSWSYPPPSPTSCSTSPGSSNSNSTICDSIRGPPSSAECSHSCSCRPHSWPHTPPAGSRIPSTPRPRRPHTHCTHRGRTLTNCCPQPGSCHRAAHTRAADDVGQRTDWGWWWWCWCQAAPRTHRCCIWHGDHGCRHTPSAQPSVGIHARDICGPCLAAPAPTTARQPLPGNPSKPSSVCGPRERRPAGRGRRGGRACGSGGCDCRSHGHGSCSCPCPCCPTSTWVPTSHSSWCTINHPVRPCCHPGPHRRSTHTIPPAPTRTSTSANAPCSRGAQAVSRCPSPT